LITNKASPTLKTFKTIFTKSSSLLKSQTDLIGRYSYKAAIESQKLTYVSNENKHSYTRSKRLEFFAFNKRHQLKIAICAYLTQHGLPSDY